MVCGFGFVSHTAKTLQGTNGFLWGLTEGLPTVPPCSNTLLEALATSSLLRAELRLPEGHLPGSYQLLGPDCCSLCLDSTIPAVPLCLCLPSHSQIELPGFSWNTLSVLVLPVPNCWQMTCFNFIFLGLLDPSFGQKNLRATASASFFCSLECVLLCLSCESTLLQISALSGQLSS